MLCEKCGKDFPEKDIQESHNVPCYLFEGETRKQRKQKADKYDRHWLCANCHHFYEGLVFGAMVKCLPSNIKEIMIDTADSFGKNWFKENKNG